MNILKLTLLNFKGVRSAVYNFKGVRSAEIRGANKSGKTTIADAIEWCLFGKNSNGDTAFSIKTTGRDGNVVHKLSHEVEVVFDCVTLKRVYSEKWKSKKGQATETLEGHTTEYYINDVSVSMKEYKERIDQIAPEWLFRSLTNPLYFTRLPWTQQREVLFNIANINNTELVTLASLQYLQGQDLDVKRKEINSKRKKLKDDRERNNNALDELNRGLTIIDVKPLNATKERISNRLVELDAELSSYAERNRVAQSALIARNLKVAELEQEKTIRAAADNKNLLDSYEAEMLSYRLKLRALNDANQEVEQNNLKLTSLTNELSRLSQQRQQLVDMWKAEKAKTFGESLNCPTCGVEFDESKKNDLIESFNLSKIAQLNSIEEMGMPIKSRIKQIEDEISTMSLATINNDKPIEPSYPAIPNRQYQDINDKIAELLSQKFESEVSPVVIVKERESLQKELSDINVEIGKYMAAKVTKERIRELEGCIAITSQEIANLDKLEFDIDEFSSIKISKATEIVNSMFSRVSFKLFNYTIDGTAKETCEAMVNGVPFSDVNTEGKLNAGLDIINTLIKHHGISMPIIIDNRESVTDIIDTDAQVISLIVDSNYLTPTVL